MAVPPALLVALVLALFLSRSPAPAATKATSFAAGTLIIPMDTDTSGNHASYNQNSGMWKAYGLVDRLLQNGIPVSWGISEAKAGITDVDVTAASVHDLRTGTDLGSWGYRGGPFIVDSADAAAAEPIIRAISQCAEATDPASAGTHPVAPFGRIGRRTCTQRRPLGPVAVWTTGNVIDDRVNRVRSGTEPTTRAVAAGAA